MYRVIKALNNNSLLVLTEEQQEAILMGKGLGFGRKSGERLAEVTDAKAYVLQNDHDKNSALQTVNGIAPVYIEIATRIIDLAQEQFQPVTTVNYPNEEAFTRITEFKHFSRQVHPGTSIVYEYPCDYQPDQGLEPYYPLFTDSAKQLYQACRDELAQFPQLIALGRLAEYRYFDMDDAVDNALQHFQHLVKPMTGR